MRKRIGTFTPLTALWSNKQKESDFGTFESGNYFIDWLTTTHQTAWQLLPLHETQLEKGSRTIRIPSPYKSYGVGLSEKFLQSQLATITPTSSELEKFKNENAKWIYDYSLFCVLTNHFRTDDWNTWPDEFRDYKKEALEEFGKRFHKQILESITNQWRLHKALEVMRKKAHDKNIILIGDMSFYVAYKSPLVWAHQDVFWLSNDRSMTYVSGVPEIGSAYFGRQIWGHPLYNWHEKQLFSKIMDFWKLRIEYLSTQYDLIRLDHAKGFYEYGAMSLLEEEHDLFLTGPGDHTFKKIVEYSNEHHLKIFAEDSGARLENLRRCLSELAVPGIRIMRFSFDKTRSEIDYVHADVDSYPHNSLSYMTTHDTETLIVYLELLIAEEKKKIANVAHVVYSSDNKIFAKRLISKVLSSKSMISILSLQDWMETTERINFPGTEKEIGDTNWKFQCSVPIENLPRVDREYSELKIDN